MRSILRTSARFDRSGQNCKLYLNNTPYIDWGHIGGGGDREGISVIHQKSFKNVAGSAEIKRINIKYVNKLIK